MSMDGSAVGPAIGTIGSLMAVGLVAKVAQGVSKSVGNSYHSNQRSHRMHSPHQHHAFAMNHKKESGRKGGYSIWHGTGF